MRRLLPANGVVTFIAETSIDEVLINRRQALLARKDVDQTPGRSCRTTARGAHCSPGAGATDDRSTGCAGGTADRRTGSGLRCRLLYGTIHPTIGGNILFAPAHAI